MTSVIERYTPAKNSNQKLNLLGCYAVSIGKYLQAFRRSMLPPSLGSLTQSSLLGLPDMKDGGSMPWRNVSTYAITSRHGEIFHKTWISINTAARNSILQIPINVKKSGDVHWGFHIRNSCSVCVMCRVVSSCLEGTFYKFIFMLLYVLRTKCTKWEA